MDVIKAILVVVVILFIGYGTYSFGKKVNYSLLYEDMVKQTIIEMVKPGALK